MTEPRPDLTLLEPSVGESDETVFAPRQREEAGLWAVRPLTPGRSAQLVGLLADAMSPSRGSTEGLESLRADASGLRKLLGRLKDEDICELLSIITHTPYEWFYANNFANYQFSKAFGTILKFWQSEDLGEVFASAGILNLPPR